MQNEFKNLEKDLQIVVEAAQALEILGDVPKGDQVCKGMKKALKDLMA